MKIEMNIGLAINGNDHSLTVEQVQIALAAHGFLITRSRVAQSATETTLCVECSFNMNMRHGEVTSPQDAVYALAVDLQQQAIAWIDSSGTGHLTGPQAAAWGSFNPDYFLPVVEAPQVPSQVTVDGDAWTREEFLRYLRETIIPDSIESGHEGYAHDLKIAAAFIDG